MAHKKGVGSSKTGVIAIPNVSALNDLAVKPSRLAPSSFASAVRAFIWRKCEKGGDDTLFATAGDG